MMKSLNTRMEQSSQQRGRTMQDKQAEQYKQAAQAQLELQPSLLLQQPVHHVSNQDGRR